MLNVVHTFISGGHPLHVTYMHFLVNTCHVPGNAFFNIIMYTLCLYKFITCMHYIFLHLVHVHNIHVVHIYHVYHIFAFYTRQILLVHAGRNSTWSLSVHHTHTSQVFDMSCCHHPDFPRKVAHFYLLYSVNLSQTSVAFVCSGTASKLLLRPVVNW